ncbi:pectin lyase-like protein [Choiromyces venosus 120613-1]|uniref:Pectin lyase-like protein n=1 Tax=Choiromyces venosus 120613-1 TaxID=1336337 RepID=A0A3N4JW20_9PEZI|nr:pectin lyase-like protein [Choiromyces venosus 120613-1]
MKVPGDILLEGCGSITDLNCTVKSNGFSNLRGGTTRSAGGATTTVSSAAAFMTAVTGHAKKTIYLDGLIVPPPRPQIRNNTSIIGLGKKAHLTGNGLGVQKASNVIIRNIAIGGIADADAISAKTSNNVWVDHCEFWSDTNHGVGYYDGLVDVTLGSSYVTISYNYFHHHYKAPLVGGDPAFTHEHYFITYHHNWFRNISTHTPALRFSEAHVYNNYYADIFAQGAHTCSGVQALIEYNVFRNVKEAISSYGKVIPEDSPNTSPDGDYGLDRFANEGFNDFGGVLSNITVVGTMTSVPYRFTCTKLKDVIKVVKRDSELSKI